MYNKGFVIKILLLEDELLLGQSMKEELQEAGYEVTWVMESDEVFNMTYENNFSLYLFDVNVPGINGFKILEALRENGDRTPTIFVTSRNQIEDLEEGFEMGASDYIKKPFNIDELLVRVASKIQNRKKSEVHYTALFSLDHKKYIVNCCENSYKIPFQELKLLEFFIENENLVTETHDIIETVFKNTISIVTFRTYIKNIKKHTMGCAIVENIRGVGYCFKFI